MRNAHADREQQTRINTGTCFIVGSYILSEEQLFSAIAVPRQSRWTWEIYLTQCDRSSIGVGLSGRWESQHPLPRTLFDGGQ